MKRLLFALSLCCAAPLPAQYLQNISNAQYSLRTLLTKESDVSYLYQVQFRNEQLFDPTAKSFHITDVIVSGVGGIGYIPGQREQYLPWSTVGSVYTGTAHGAAPQRPLAFRPNWFDIANDNGLYAKRLGGSFTSTNI